MSVTWSGLTIGGDPEQTCRERTANVRSLVMTRYHKHRRKTPDTLIASSSNPPGDPANLFDVSPGHRWLLRMCFLRWRSMCLSSRTGSRTSLRCVLFRTVGRRTDIRTRRQEPGTLGTPRFTTTAQSQSCVNESKIGKKKIHVSRSDVFGNTLKLHPSLIFATVVISPCQNGMVGLPDQEAKTTAHVSADDSHEASHSA
jgi:hypothetical protein